MLALTGLGREACSQTSWSVTERIVRHEIQCWGVTKVIVPSVWPFVYLRVNYVSRIQKSHIVSFTLELGGARGLFHRLIMCRISSVLVGFTEQVPIAVDVQLTRQWSGHSGCRHKSTYRQ